MRADEHETVARIVTRVGFGLAATSVVVATAVAAMLHLGEVGHQVLVKAHIVGLG